MNADRLRCTLSHAGAPVCHRTFRHGLFLWLCAWLVAIAWIWPENTTHAKSQHNTRVWNASAQLQHPASRPTWRDTLLPWSDPLRTEPDGLFAPLRVRLPPELRMADGSATDTEQDDGMRHPVVPIACAERPSHLSRLEIAAGVAATALQGAGNVSAQRTPPPLPLARAIDLALCHNPDIRASWSQIAQQAAALGQARSQYWPHAQAVTEQQRDRVTGPQSFLTETDVIANTTRQSLSIDWRLWDFGGRHARIDAAKAQLQAAIASQNTAALQALGAILTQYTEAQIAYVQWQEQLRLLPLLERIVESLEKQQRAGIAPINAVLQAQTARARVDLACSRAQGEYEKAIIALTSAMGVSAPSDPTAYQLDPPALPDGSDSSHADPLLTRATDAWRERVTTNHPTLIAAKAQWQAAQAAIVAAQADALPALSLNSAAYFNSRATVGFRPTPSREWLVGLRLTIPLFDGFESVYKTRSAQARAEQQAIAYETTQAQLLHETAQRLADARASWRTIAPADRLLQFALRTTESLQRQLHHGVSDLPSLNHALTELLQAQQDATQAHTQWLRARLFLLILDASISAEARAPR